jgi:hypothetical protein
MFQDIINETFQQNWKNHLNYLKLVSSNIQYERGDICCRWKKKRKFVIFRKKVCVFWNPVYGDQAA